MFGHYDIKDLQKGRGLTKLYKSFIKTLKKIKKYKGFAKIQKFH
jgi:hypothetical protein